MTRERESRPDRPMSEVVQEVAASLGRFEALATGHLESMGETLILSRDVILRSKDRLATLKLREDRMWK